MANTYTLISSNVLSSSAASVTFSAIPSTYTDLVIRWSARDTTSTAVGVTLYLQFNANTGTGQTIYSYTRLRGTGSAADSGLDANFYRGDSSLYNGTSSTANTFASGEFYIPSYTASQNKPYSNFNVDENNATLGYILASAGLYRDTSAINSTTITALGTAFAIGSSFYLYGISKN
jgi:hypothetical protein